MERLHESSPPTARRRRRRILWVVGVLMLLAAMLLVPPLVNVNRYAHRIAVSMSASLGRSVHLDSVELQLLPMPAVVLRNLVVSEAEGFGDEPTIRANSVVATVRLSSLWRRRIEFGSVTFQDPSVNLVRRADGRWNLESILLHAAQTQTAPTAQTHAGPTPRFPYIEATGARVNIKNGDEKTPWSLTDAKFALWLPEADQWHVRLEGTPARTDTNVDDPGTLRIEGTLDRAEHAAAVPVDLTLRWSGAPLGQVDRVLTGADGGWRGTLNVLSQVRGTLGKAAWTAELQANDVHRSDFAPAHLMSLAMKCSGDLSATTAVMTAPACAVKWPDDSTSPVPHLSVQAASLELTGLRASSPEITLQAVPLAWFAGWMELYSPRVPAAFTPEGRASGTLRSAVNDGLGSWDGALQGTLVPLVQSVAENTRKGPSTPGEFSVTVADGEATSTPLALTEGATANTAKPLSVTAVAAPTGVTLRFTGSANAAELRKLRAVFPPLTDGLPIAATAAPGDVEAQKSAAPADANVGCGLHAALARRAKLRRCRTIRHRSSSTTTQGKDGGAELWSCPASMQLL